MGYFFVTDYVINGRDAPNSIEAFTDLDLSHTLLTNVSNCGYNTPNLLQMNLMPCIKDNRDVLVLYQGGEEILPFLVPIVQKMLHKMNTKFPGKPTAIILAPSRASAVKITTETKKIVKNLDINIQFGYSKESADKIVEAKLLIT